MPARPLPCAGGVSITSPVIVYIVLRHIYIVLRYIYSVTIYIFSVIVRPLYIFSAGVQYSDSIVKAVVARLVVALLI